MASAAAEGAAAGVALCARAEQATGRRLPSIKMADPSATSRAELLVYVPLTQPWYAAEIGRKRFLLRRNHVLDHRKINRFARPTALYFFQVLRSGPV